MSVSERAAYLPDFLIVGAMKSGTTTLYRDLILHPDVFMPEDKEPETLANSSDPDQIRREYRTLFPRLAEGLVKGEASTAYTKRPDFEGVAERAREVLGPGLKVVYMRRDPVERLVVVYMTQLIPAGSIDDHGKVRALVYQAIVEPGRN